MTFTTYYATYTLGRRDANADAIVHQVNDLAAGNGDCRSWDTMRTHIDALADADTQKQLGIVIEADVSEAITDD